MKMENVSVCNESQALPPLVIAALNVRTSLNSKSQQNEVVMIAILIHHKYHVNKESPKPPFQQHICCKYNYPIQNLMCGFNAQCALLNYFMQ